MSDESEEFFVFPDDPFATELSWSGEPPLEALYVYFSRKEEARRSAEQERLARIEAAEKQIREIQAKIEENRRKIAKILAGVEKSRSED